MSPSILLGLMVGAVLGASSALAAEDTATALLGKLLGPTPLAADLRELTDTIGGRPTGSLALDQAVAWAISRFMAAGLEDVHAETYTASRLWLARSEEGEILAPREPWQTPGSDRVRVAAMPYSAPTPAGGLEAEVVDVQSGEDTDFAAAGEKARGRWLLVHTAAMRTMDDLTGEYAMTPGVLARAKQSRAAGLLWMSSRPGRLLYRHNLTFDGSVFPLPAGVVEREGALRVARLLAAGQTVRVRLTLLIDTPERVPARNVVAQIRGREKPEEVIVLGAHLDSWDLGRGAQDNGCNVALVIDVARQAMALARAGMRPRRTLRFALYSGEENGFFGSFGEVRDHRAELDRIKAQIVFDIGSGRITGFSLDGRMELKASVDSALQPVDYLGPFVQTTEPIFGTDNYDYLVEGVPNLVAVQEGASYPTDYHAESDTYDKVDGRELKTNAAIAAVLTWELADTAQPPAPRQSRAEIEALVKSTSLERSIKNAGLWDDFQSGARGRQP